MDSSELQGALNDIESKKKYRIDLSPEKVI